MAKDQETDNPREIRKKSSRIYWIIPLLVALAACAVGYLNFWKKNALQPLDCVPNDAAYVLQINDNQEITQTISGCLTQLEPLMNCDAIEVFEHFLKQFDSDKIAESQVVMSSHWMDGKLRALLAIPANSRDLESVLRGLNKNPKDNFDYKGIVFYEISTHYHTCFFCLHKGFFLAAEDEMLLRRVIDVMGTQQCLTRCADYEKIGSLLKKNTKQNWLLIHNEKLIDAQISKLEPVYKQNLLDLKQYANWSAFVVTFSDKSVQLSGYCQVKPGTCFDNFRSAHSLELPVSVLPWETAQCMALNLASVKKFLPGSSPASQQSCKVLGDASAFYFTFAEGEELQRCIALVADTSAAFRQSLCAEDSAVGPVATCLKHPIYASSCADFPQAILNATKTLKASYFVENQGVYVFADSVPVLKNYLNRVGDDRNVAGNEAFMKSIASAPSQCAFAFYRQNPDNEFVHFWKPVRRNQSVFTFQTLNLTVLPAVNGWVPCNVFIQF